MNRVNQRMESQRSRGLILGASQPDLPCGYFIVVEGKDD
jgi:hypothetical protein